MFDKIKDLLANWKVSVALVGGAVVVATTFGTCTVEPGEPEIEAEEAPVEAPAEDQVGEESSVTEGEGNSTEEATTQEANTVEATSTATENDSTTEE